MNNDVLLKLIEMLLEGKTGEKKSALHSDAIGRYVIVRSRNEGINAGYVEDMDETGVVLKDARRLWYHKPKDSKQAWYEGVANTGVSKDSKLSAPVVKKVIVESYSITICTKEAEESIKGAGVYHG